MDQFEKAITEIEFNKNKKDVLDQIGLITESCDIIAKFEKIHFDALISNGFTKDQALEIVKFQGIHPGEQLRNENKKD